MWRTRYGICAMSVPAVQSARSMARARGPLSLLAGWPVNLRRVLGQLQRPAELLLGEQLMRLHVLKGARARDRDAQRGGADRVGGIADDNPVVGPEHPVDRLKRAAQGVKQLPYRSGPVARGVDHPCPGVA